MRFLVALALLVSVTPGMTEVIEAAAHLVAHGDLPHHADAEEAPGECNEHTCTPLAHHCGCHGTMSAQTTSRTISFTSTFVTSKSNYLLTTSADRVSEPPPLRPPIA